MPGDAGGATHFPDIFRSHRDPWAGQAGRPQHAAPRVRGGGRVRCSLQESDWLAVVRLGLGPQDRAPIPGTLIQYDVIKIIQ